MQVSFNDINYSTIIAKIAKAWGSHSDGINFLLPEKAGSGDIKSWQLQDDISVMLMNCIFYHDLFLYRKPNNYQQFLVFHFYDVIRLDGAISGQNVFYIQQHALGKNAICISNNSINSTIHLPAQARIAGISILCNKNFLTQFIDISILEACFSNYYYREIHEQQLEYLDAGYRALLYEIILEHQHHPFTNQFIYSRLLLLLEKLIINFYDKLNAGSLKTRMKSDEINIMMHTEAELLKDFSTPTPGINELAKMAGMSPTKFKMQFKNLFGLPVYEYFQKNRMLFAKQLLKQGDHTIQEVGTAVGYTNLGHFAAAFKKEFGLLPKDWVYSENKLKPLHPDKN